MAPPIGATGGGGWPTPTATERSGLNPITGRGAGLWHAVRMWPTPTSYNPNQPLDTYLDRREKIQAERGNNGFGLHLGMAVKMWPTPRAGNVDGESPERFLKAKEDGKVSTPPLGLAVRMWPTPTARLSEHKNPKLDEKNRRIAAKPGGGTYGLDLSDSVKMWPTPMASYHKGTGPLGSKSHKHRLDRGYLDATVQDAEQKSGQLNPDWVEKLMGLPVGYTKPDGPPVREILDPAEWLNGSWEEGIPRLTDVKKGRRARLKMLGNSVVPQCVAFLAEKIAIQYRINQIPF